MSQFQQRDMSGVLFKNDKGDNPKRPDYTGEITINGEVLKLSAWIKEGQRGKFMSLSAAPKEERQPAQHAAPKAKATNSSFDDMKDDDFSDVPF